MVKSNKYRCLRNEVKEKRCSTCHKWKQYSKFTTDKRKNDGYDYRCKICERLRKKKYDRQDYRIKDQAYDHYGGYVCVCCGETEPKFLTIDHINNDGAEHRKRMRATPGPRNIYSWLKKHNYPEGFQILCMNCNWGKMLNKGVCPHKP